MNTDAHERARKLIALVGPEALSGADLRSSDAQSSNVWLAAHVETCASCRAFAENAAETIRGLRGIPIVHIVRRRLEIPGHLTGIDVDGHDGTGV